jgi:hypothetical protein
VAILLQAKVDGQGSAWRALVVASFNYFLVYLTTLLMALFFIFFLIYLGGVRPSPLGT